MKPTNKAYGDRAKRTGSELDTPSKLAILAGLIGLVTLMWYGGVLVDAFISLVEMV